MDYERVLVDGHSVLYGCPELTALFRRSPQRAREQLLSWLVQFQDSAHINVTLVFDGGRRVRAAPREPIPAGLELLYSEPGETADAVIERRVAAIARNAKTLVVTNDRVERLTVEGFGAETMSVESFLDWLERERVAFDRRLGEVRRQARRYRNFP